MVYNPPTVVHRDCTGVIFIPSSQGFAAAAAVVVVGVAVTDEYDASFENGNAIIFRFLGQGDS